MELKELYAAESARIQRDFSASSDGRAALLGRTALVDTIARRLWNELISPEIEGPRNFALIALGGYGRRWLFPHSDVDLMFLHAGGDTEKKFKTAIRSFSQELWDLRLKLSPATRTLAECERFDPNNVEFAISLLDCRYLAGDPHLFSRLHDKLIPKLVSRESRLIVQKLTDLTRGRYNKFGDTVFHLEPNVKDGPGGLRDYNLACWLALISAIDERGAWPDEATLLPAPLRQPFEDALTFLMSVRCFLHFRYGRDDNTLAWAAQDEAAASKIGAPNSRRWTRPNGCASIFAMRGRCTAWRRSFSMSFRRRALPCTGNFRICVRVCRTRSLRVVDSRIFLQRPESLGDPGLPLRMFRFMARHGLALSSTTEHQMEQVLGSLAANPPKGAELWHYLQEILVAPHAADALRTMHSLGLLTLLVPEMKGIDALVIRDYSHRLTVDEHTFVAIENLHKLRQSHSSWDQRYAELLDELEQPDLLYLALLLHDTGKAMKNDSHVIGSVALAKTCLDRLDLDDLDRETVLFLINRHMELSAALRRDIFDPSTIHQFARKMETPERLKMLCLLTYADIKAVNPEALTPWKAENIWQLYISTANHMLRTADERLHVDEDDEVLTHLRTLAPAAGKKLESFLEGLPRRYLRTQAAGEILSQMEMASNLDEDPVQLSLTRGRHWYELTLVTRDRPFLFSKWPALAAWGMNIVKAAAFSNRAGVVVDTFFFTDRFRTLELNLPEWERFKTKIHDVLVGKADLDRMLKDRYTVRKECHRQGEDRNEDRNR